jgi:drug/metabolite transporter (DMT)-like permease
MQAEPTQTGPIVINLAAAVVGALGQYAYKRGAARLATEPLIKNVSLFAGVILFCLVMVLFVWSFKLGGRLSVVYPMYATTFLWGTALGIWLDSEPWSALQLLGGAMVVAGLAVVAIGAPR